MKDGHTMTILDKKHTLSEEEIAFIESKDKATE